jgi:HlyD family secretion protein
MNIQAIYKNKYKSALILILLIILFILLRNDSNAPTFKTATVTMGDMKSFIQATGKIEPTRKAEISAEIIGQVKEIYVDYNSKVQKDQVLALIDPTDFELKLSEAKANLVKANADFELSKSIYNSNKTLFNKNLISKEELKNSKVLYSSALASREQAQVALENAKSDLANTKIVSPIQGSVIGKNIVTGQTVTQKQNGPPLFTVADNLDKMIVVTSVNEIDIGKVKIGNKCEFVTDAYPEKKYSGEIKQIISEPSSINNLVAYDVLIEFNNNEKKLKPGMTASVEILVDNKKDVLMVDRSALRFIPPSSEFIVKNTKYSEDDEILWAVTRNKKLKPIIIKTGAKNDTYIEIIEGKVKENDKIVIQSIFKSGSNNGSGQISVPGVKRF